MTKRILIICGLLTTFVLCSSFLYAAEINLAAGLGMKDVLNELTDVFIKNNPGIRFRKNYAASGPLAKQIENGAPADVFISANQKWMKYLKEKKLVEASSISTFAFNSLVFAGLPGKATSMQDLLKLEKIAIGSPLSVPAGEYAAEALRKAGFDKQMEKKLVMARDVRECLVYAERGEVDGAFVYRTDVIQAAKHAKILFTVPQELYSRVTYPMALTAVGANKPEAAAFFAFLKSPKAKEVLVKSGFKVE